MKVVGEHLHQCCARFFKPQLQSRSKEKAPPSHPRTTKAFTSPRFLLAGKGILTAGSGLGELQRQKGRVLRVSPLRKKPPRRAP